MLKAFRTCRHILLGFAVAALTACGGGGGGDGGAAPPAADTAPLITVQPGNLSAPPGIPVTFSVTATGTAPLTYQWQRNGTNLSGATAASLTFLTASTDNGATYRVVVSNAVSSVTSNPGTLTIVSASSVGTLNGIVASAGASAPMAASGSVPGRPAASSTATQSFNIQSVPASERIVLRTSAAGHLDQLKIAAVRAGAVSLVRSVLAPTGASAVLDPASGGTVQVSGSSAQLVFPANAFARTDNGAAPSGSASVTLTPIAGGQDPDRLPGDSSTLTGATVGNLDSLGAVGITMVDTTGQSLRLASGKQATLRIPVSSRDTAALPTAPALYTLDELTARWVASGTTTLAGSGAGRYFEASIATAGYFSAAQAIDVVLVRGCTQLGTSFTRNRSVRTEGIDDTLAGYAFTDTSGNFSVPIRKGARAVLITTGGTESTAPVVVGPSTTDLTLGACLVERGVNNSVPSFIAAPASLSAAVGDTVHFHVVVDGNLPIGLQWLRNGVALPGETGTGLTVFVGADDNGARYTVVATNAQGTMTNAAGVLSVSGVGTGQACYDGIPAAGARFQATYDMKNNGVSYGTRNYDALTGGTATFESHSARVTSVSNSSTSVVNGVTVVQSSDTQNYGAATAVGEITRYGSDGTSSVIQLGTTTNFTTKIVFTPPWADHFSGMKVGDVITQSFTTVITGTTNGVTNPSTTSTTTQTISFDAIEMLVLPAGSFQACRYTSDTGGTISQFWALLGRGETLKTITGTQMQEATSVTVTP